MLKSLRKIRHILMVTISPLQLNLRQYTPKTYSQLKHITIESSAKSLITGQSLNPNLHNHVAYGNKHQKLSMDQGPQSRHHQSKTYLGFRGVSFAISI